MSNSNANGNGIVGEAPPPSTDELIQEMDDFAVHIETSLTQYRQILMDTLQSVDTNINAVEEMLKELDIAIDNLLKTKTVDREEERRLRKEIDRLNQSRGRVKDTLDKLKKTYNDKLGEFRDFTKAYEDLPNRLKSKIVDRVSNMRNKYSPRRGSSDDNDIGRTGGKFSSSGRKSKQAKRMSMHRKTKKGGYIWFTQLSGKSYSKRPKTSSSSKKRRAKKTSSRTSRS